MKSSTQIQRGIHISPKSDGIVETLTMPPQDSACIHSVFEKRAEKTPNAVALRFEGQSLTYGELNARANQLAHYLRKHSVGPETPVALCLDRSPEMIVAILGVLKAGGAYVPIDLAYPKERLSFMLEDTQAPIILIQQKLLSSLPDHTAKVICLDSEWEKITGEPIANLPLCSTGENIAYIIFTSGSTGKPKGVLVTHRNVTRLLTQTEHWFRFNSNDVWTLFHSYAFDFSVWEIWGALLYGGRLVVVPYLVSRSPNAFYELLGKEKVTVLNQTPSAFRQLIWAEETASTKCKLHLRYVIFGGEALELQSLKPWFERHGDEQPQLINMYGITETTVHVTYRRIRRADLENGLGSVIGVPIPDLQLHLLDENMKPVPAGVPGEIFVGGAGVARGYLNRPELTSERFVPDPFAKSSGRKLYRSGDLAQYRDNGELEYLGRIDHQVKIRGFRIELGEIEAALNRHPAIRESVVVPQDTSTGDKRLVGYIVPNPGVPSVSELRQFLGQRIPEYMIPAAFVFLPALPLTPNGKVDKRALPSPDATRPSINDSYVAPRNLTEHRLADIWSQVLEFDQVGIYDNFFDLGGDSIRAIALLSRAQQQGLHFSLQQLFANPTVAGLAAATESVEGKQMERSLPFAQLSAENREKLPADVEDAYPMSKLQIGMFYFNEVNPNSAVYHDVFSFRIEAPLDQNKLEQSTRQLLQRHPVLRTSFHMAGFSEPLQLVHKNVKPPFTVEDLRSMSSAEQDERLVAWIETEKRTPFNRTEAPLIRFHTQWRGDTSFQFIVSFHHVYLDGWSLAALMTEVMQDYTALREGAGETIAPPRISYREFIALENEAIRSESCQKFWADKIAEARPQNLPRWPKAMCAGGQEQVRGPEIQFDPTILEGLKRLAQTAGVPLKTVLLAAHQRVMSALYGQTDVMSGLVCNGRPEEIDGEKLIGLFLNTLPVRQQLNGGPWLDLVKQTFIAEQEILPHRRFPLAEIQKLNGGQPLFEAAFDFVHFHVYKNLQGTKNMGFMEGHYFEANNLTTLTTFMLDVTSTQLQMHFDYDPNALCREQIAIWSDHYVNTLKAMASDPNGRYEQFSPLSPAEREQILVQWNATQEDYPREKCLHELFEEQAAKKPEAAALLCENVKLTYAELNGRANQLAHQLRGQKVRPETPIGIFIERSAEMVIAMLAVLKAGGAYVPLDPAYPKERLAHMISDARIPVILSQSRLSTALPESGAQILLCDLETQPREQNSPNFPSESSSRNSAYVIYTSGSTGKPKGVPITHRSAVNLLVSMAGTTNFTERDSLLAVTTFSFDISVLEIFLPLITGGQLLLASREKTSDAIKLAAIFDTLQPSVMQATPAMWRSLIEAGWQGHRQLKIFCGGESLPRNLADELLKRAGEVWNVYGPTETTIWSTAWKVDPAAETISIGRPLANTQVYILDQNLQPLPVGVAGELYLGGDGLTRGYLNRPELTAEKFISNPFDQMKSRLYRTGDLARYLPDGNIECLGRIDHQVKVRGFRIELGEIESALRQNPAIKEALVVAREDKKGDKSLVAYLISRNGELPSVSDLRDFLKTKLPDYMIPGACVGLKKFPLTPSGKIDRKALPVPDQQDRVAPNRTFVAPRSPLEEDLAAVWREVFKAEQIGVEDNFFDLGGHSLTAIQMIVRIRKQFGVELPLQSLFEAPTIGSLANVILTKLLSETDEDLSQTLKDLDQISDEEAGKLLVAEGASLASKN